MKRGTYEIEKNRGHSVELWPLEFSDGESANFTFAIMPLCRSGARLAHHAFGRDTVAITPQPFFKILPATARAFCCGADTGTSSAGGSDFRCCGRDIAVGALAMLDGRIRPRVAISRFVICPAILLAQVGFVIGWEG